MKQYTVSIDGNRQNYEWRNYEDDSRLVLIYVGLDERHGRSQ